jgi:hypothetical protein
LVGILGREINPTKCLYLHTTTQRRKTKINIHATSGIRTHDISHQVIKAYDSGNVITGTDHVIA